VNAIVGKNEAGRGMHGVFSANPEALAISEIRWELRFW
jgi:hypothetical protein